MTENTYNFIGGNNGYWKVINMHTIIGEPLENVAYLNIIPANTIQQNNGVWKLTGFTSNIRYAQKTEKEKLLQLQTNLGQPLSTCAALIPIRKHSSWWNLAQDERREIFEAQSHHTEIGIRYLPAIARKLYHCRDIGEPFDFLTWFEYVPEMSAAFEELVVALRKTNEWKFVDREIDIRLVKV